MRLPPVLLVGNHCRSMLGPMATIEVSDAAAAGLRDQAARAGVSVERHILRLAVMDSARESSQMLDETFYADAEAERLAS